MRKVGLFSLWIVAIGTMVVWLVLFVKEHENHYIAYGVALISWLGLLLCVDCLPEREEGDAAGELQASSEASSE